MSGMILRAGGFALLMALGLLSIRTAHAQSGPCANLNTLCVGSDTNCHFSSLQDAINAAPTSGAITTSVRISGNQAYTAQNLVIDGRNLTLTGGYSSCSDYIPSGRTVVDGSGASGDSVITIISSSGHRSVSLRNLEIRGGGTTWSDVRGGGISISDNVAVELRNVAVVANNGRFGAGIHIDGSEGAVLAVTLGSEIRGNTATGNGGGLHCNAGAEVSLTDSAIIENLATATAGEWFEFGEGAGAYLDDCTFSATGDADTHGIRSNFARFRGGGVLALNGSTVNLYGSAAGPLLLTNNVAGESGGGMKVSDSLVYLSDTAIVGNQAGTHAPLGSGGGLHVERSSVLQERDQCSGCSRISNNSTTGTLEPGPGGGIYVRAQTGDLAASSVIIDGASIDGNQPSALNFEADYTPGVPGTPQIWAKVRNSVLAANPRVIGIQGKVNLEVVASTLADNLSDALDGPLIDNATQQGDVFMLANLVREVPGTAVLGEAAETVRIITCLMAHSGHGLGPLPTLVVSDDPGFVDVSSLDYRLRWNSRAIDFCPHTTGMPVYDRVQTPRGQDVDQIPDLFPGGTFDLGAYEWIFVEVIFAHGFEAE